MRTYRSDAYIMSRPKPTVLLEITNKKTFKTEQVLDAEAIWAVFYKDKPINLKTNSIVAQQVGPKYKKAETPVVANWKGPLQTQNQQDNLENWWEIFEDETLNHLEEKLLRKNYDLYIAFIMNRMCFG